MKKINIGVIAHVDSGKTTVTEQFLYQSGVLREAGRVDKGNAATDSMALERRRGISIKAAATSFYWKDCKINLIDTPGHVDFIAEVERALQVLDGVVLVISAREGIQAQTKVFMDIIQSMRIPALVFINKLDRTGADYQRVCHGLDKALGGRTVLVSEADREGTRDVEVVLTEKAALHDKMLAALSEIDDECLECFVENRTLPEAYLEEKLAAYIRAGELYPVFLGAALYGAGVAALLDGIVRFLPLADERADEPLSGVVFKIETEPSERRAFVRLYAGSIRLRETVSYRGKSDKVKHLSLLENGKLIPGSVITGGDIGVLYGKELQVGDTVGEKREGMRDLRLARPTLKALVVPDDPAQRTKLYDALSIMASEDPLLDFVYVPEDNHMYINLFGEVQMEIVKELLWEIYGIGVSFSSLVTICKETVSGTAQASSMLGGDMNPYRAGVALRVEPLERGAGFQYHSEVWLGSLMKPFQRAVEEAVVENHKRGVYGWEMTDMKVTFYNSQFDSVTSTPADFRNLTPMVMLEAIQAAGVKLLEPILAFELRTPPHVAGQALYDCRRLDAEVKETISLEDEFVVRGVVPVETSKGYAASVASYTEGQGVFVTRLHGYRETAYDERKVNHAQRNIAANKRMYLLHKADLI